MQLRFENVELFGVTESSATLCFSLRGPDGPAAETVEVLVNGDVRARSSSPAATHVVRVEGLTPDTSYTVDLRAPGAAAPERDRHFDGTVHTHPAPRGKLVGTFATLNDLHFGEEFFGGSVEDGRRTGRDASNSKVIWAADTEVPYAQFMNEDAVTNINACNVDFTLIKGDIADTGTAEQFALARRTFARLERPHHVMLGNHDLCPEDGNPCLDGYDLLQAAPCPRAFEHGGWLFVLLDSVLPGHHHGAMEATQLEFLRSALAAAPHMPTLVVAHHHFVCRGEDTYFPNTISVPPEQSHQLFELVGRHAQIKAVLTGHSHRNNVRTYPESGEVPFIEVGAVKDYPGVFATYRIFDDGELRQEVRRIESRRALDHSTRCSAHLDGLYRWYALGKLRGRSLVVGART